MVKRKENSKESEEQADVGQAATRTDGANRSEVRAIGTFLGTPPVVYGTVILLLSSVTEPFSASARPVSDASVPKEIDA